MGAMVVLLSVRVCDVCKRVGIETRHYTVTEGGRTVETDRCGDHADTLEEILEAESPQVEEGSSATPSAPADEVATLTRKLAEPESKPAAKKAAAPAKKTAAKKAVAKKAQSRRPKVTTVAEIEQSKRK
ncbi:hypothetical protein ACWD5Q_25510 [Streptomyces sp. NPDC002513]